ncbi:hypothetical protein [Mycolicibacterium sp. S3B2]|uniref:hypothetical protein n=1 Tax=Mycolicibacterium sp. S3B2 TaxID=3415120 RepID=UPI003C79DB65
MAVRAFLATAISIAGLAFLPAFPAGADDWTDESLLSDAAAHGVTAQWVCGVLERDGFSQETMLSVWEVVYEKTGWIDSLAGEVAPAAIRVSCPQFVPAYDELMRGYG